MNNLKEESLNKFYEELAISDDSKKSYISYVTNAIKHFEKHYNNEFDFYDKVQNECNSICALLNSYLTEIKLGKINDVSPKTAWNYSSAFSIYQDILSDICDNKNKTLNNYLANISPIIYTKKDIIKVFLNRLVTQDREYEHIKFPTRIINKICPKGWFRNLLKSSIERTIIYDGNGTEYTFSDLDKLIIVNNKIIAQFNNKKIEVYSPTVDYKDYVIFDGSKGLPELSLDHKNSLYDIIEGNYTAYMYLGELSNNVKGIGYKSQLLDRSFIDNSFIDNLKNDVSNIINKTQLVIMSKSLNSSKNKKIV